MVGSARNFGGPGVSGGFQKRGVNGINRTRRQMA